MWQPVAGFKASSQTNTAAASASAQTAVPPSMPGATPSPKSAPPSESDGIVSNFAVHRCVSAYRQAHLAAGGANKTPGARDAAENAFRNALPDIVDRASAADFMACVIKGMTLSIFWQQEGPRLVNAAKATMAAFPLPPHRAASNMNKETACH